MEATTRKNAVATLVAGVIAAVGLTASIGLLWVAGTLGISTAAASQIVQAIMVGGWALTLVMTIFGAGIIGAITATVRWYVGNLGTAMAVA